VRVVSATGRIAKQSQRADEFFVIARTEALIAGLGLDEAPVFRLQRLGACQEPRG
jgi:2-methylisocitrate lyase-like PEP mutase family enzyme